MSWLETGSETGSGTGSEAGSSSYESYTGSSSASDSVDESALSADEDSNFGPMTYLQARMPGLPVRSRPVRPSRSPTRASLITTARSSLTALN